MSALDDGIAVVRYFTAGGVEDKFITNVAEDGHISQIVADW